MGLVTAPGPHAADSLMTHRPFRKYYLVIQNIIKIYIKLPFNTQAAVIIDQHLRSIGKSEVDIFAGSDRRKEWQ
ncbi:MAG: hypothetical protein K0B16_15790 [Burkholderiaceae bacterium]|nr:hypothetical protein [Burkholderiaceae bacterium]